MKSIKIYKLVLDYRPKDFNELINGLSFPESVNIHNKKVGILVGSRGISNLDRVVSKVIKELKNRGGKPYIIPAMGSHGGGTRKGQLSLLEKLEISSKRLGVKIISSNSYLEIGKIFKNNPVVINAIVKKMDLFVGVNRIKPHSRFNGTYESGILKLLSTGLGFVEGAKCFHKNVEQYGFEETLLQTSDAILKRLKFLYFICIIEDRLGATLDIKVISPSMIYEQEKSLLKIAKKNMPFIPFLDIDLLIINKMGKNISGGGIDPCVIGGKKGNKRIAKRIYVRALSAGSDGNAFGMGLADFISHSFYRSIDFDKTYKNSLSSMNLNSVKAPICLNSDLKALQFAAESLGKSFDDNLKIVWIENTTDLKQIYITSNLLSCDLERYRPIANLKLLFDKRGNLKIE